jgi:hypothetical protein
MEEKAPVKKVFKKAPRKRYAHSVKKSLKRSTIKT